jgi:hypothetical protein
MFLAYCIKFTFSDKSNIDLMPIDTNFYDGYNSKQLSLKPFDVILVIKSKKTLLHFQNNPSG